MRTKFGCLVPLERLDNPLDCGAKAYNLGRLACAGYRIPCGTALPVTVMQQHLANSDVLTDNRTLLAELQALDAAEVLKRASSIRCRILEAPISADVQADIAENYDRRWRGKSLAVRSSAIYEDSEQASFAGQLDSVLGVDTQEDLESAIRTVWASFWSDRCLFYARGKGLRDARMGVVIQEMVDARYSGVLFSRDPCATGPGEEIVIEYTDGRGDLLAAGQTTPRRVRVCRQSLALTYDDTAVEERRGTISDAKLRELARVGLELERTFESPQDIEWSIDAAEQIVLLQTRPITATESADLVVWSNANIAENYPGPVSPFLNSIVSQGYTSYFRGLARAYGISRHRLLAMNGAFENVVGVHAGRLYYNLTNIHTLINLAPFGPWLTSSFNDFTGAREFPRITVLKSGPVRRTAELVRIIAQTAWQYLRIESRVARFERTVDQYADRTKPQTLAPRSAQELLELIRGFLEIRVQRWTDAALADVAAMVCYQLLKHFLSSRIGSREQVGLHNDLLKGLPNLASTRPTTELWRLSRLVREDPELFGVFSGHAASEILTQLEQPKWRNFRDCLELYLDNWGFRYSRELMLTTPTPQEQPRPVIRLLQSYSHETEAGPEGLWEEQALQRQRVTESTATRLTLSSWRRMFPLSRAVQFRLLLRATQSAIRLRERARMKQALLYTRLRHVMLHAGDFLVRKGYLEDRDHVFFLTIDEVQSLLSGTAMVPVATIGTVKLRLQECAGFEATEPPDSFELPRGEQWSTDAMSTRTDKRPSGPALHGTGACGGTADGIASVVLDVTDAGRVRRDQILVTRQTDPGWATVFFLIKGLVVERGGMLSHGAIIAREYGIPTVVGVPEATDRIHSGDRLRLNGDSGVVELCH